MNGEDSLCPGNDLSQNDLSSGETSCLPEIDSSEFAKMAHELTLTKELLEETKNALQSKETALSELLRHLEDEKRKVLSVMASNLEFSVLPMLDQLIEQDSEMKKQLVHIKKNLEEIADPVLRNVQSASESLTPKELQLCSLIRHGMTVKEIAAMMHLSPRTIDKHRENIRKKLHITDRKTNLGAYLASHFR